MLFILVLLVIGLVSRQSKRYWLFAAGAVLVQTIVALLFAGGGTLQDPTGDGLITRVIRKATNDGPAMGLVGLFVVTLAWGLPIWIVSRGFQRKRAASALDASDGSVVSGSRLQ